jgi:hypothetical protein
MSCVRCDWSARATCGWMLANLNLMLKAPGVSCSLVPRDAGARPVPWDGLRKDPSLSEQTPRSLPRGCSTRTKRADVLVAWHERREWTHGRHRQASRGRKHSVPFARDQHDGPSYAGAYRAAAVHEWIETAGDLALSATTPGSVAGCSLVPFTSSRWSNPLRPI